MHFVFDYYITIGPKILRQTFGIPIGSNPAPSFANLFLYFYKLKWMNKINKNGLLKNRKLYTNFRFIDYSNSIYDCAKFETSYYVILIERN